MARRVKKVKIKRICLRTKKGDPKKCLKKGYQVTQGGKHKEFAHKDRAKHTAKVWRNKGKK